MNRRTFKRGMAGVGVLVVVCAIAAAVIGVCAGSIALLKLTGMSTDAAVYTFMGIVIVACAFAAGVAEH